MIKAAVKCPLELLQKHREWVRVAELWVINHPGQSYELILALGEDWHLIELKVKDDYSE